MAEPAIRQGIPGGIQLAAALLSIAAFSVLVLKGVAPFVVLAVVICSIIALYRPMVVVAGALVIAPLLGRTGDSLIGPLNGMAVLAIWVLAMSVVAVLMNFDLIRRQRVIVIAALLPALGLISVFFSSQRGVSLVEILRMMSALALLPLAYLLSDSLERRKIIVGLVLASCFVPVLVGIYQLITGDIDYGPTRTMFEIESGISRINGTFYDVHPFAKYLLMPLLLISAYLISTQYSLRQQLALFGMSALLFLCLVQTYARSQLIGFVLGLGLLLLAYRKLTYRTVFLLGIAAALLIMTTGAVERFADLFQGIDLASSDRTNSLKGRIIIWGQGLPLALQSPWIGHGAATFEHDIGIKSHNVYLGLFYEMGIVAPILYLWLLRAGGRAVKSLAVSPLAQVFDRNLCMAVWSLSIVILVVSLVENYAQSTVMWWAFFALLGAGLRAADAEKLRVSQ